MTILSLPAKGHLKVKGTALAEGDFAPPLTAANIGAGQLTYSPLADEHGDRYASFTFKVNDGTEDSASYTMTINVNKGDDGTVPLSSTNTAPTARGAEVTATEDTGLHLYRRRFQLR